MDARIISEFKEMYRAGQIRTCREYWNKYPALQDRFHHIVLEELAMIHEKNKEDMGL